MGNAQEKLAQQKNAKDISPGRPNQGMVRIEPAQTAHQKKHRDQGHLTRHHDGEKQSQKEKISAGELQPGKSVSGQAADEKANHRCAYTNDHAVEKPAC